MIGAPVFSAAAYHNSSAINFELRVNIEELRRGCIKSPDIQLSSLFWTVQLCSTSNFVSISLVSHFERDAPKWSSEAQAIFKLISNDGDDNKTIKRNITKRLFDAYNQSQSVSFLSWDTIKDEYIHEGESILDIEIAVDEPVRKHETEQISTKAIILVENVSKLSSYPYRSPSFMVRGIRWNIEFKKLLNNALVGFLHAERKDLSRSESWLVKATIDLLSWKDDYVSRSREFNRRFGARNSSGECAMFDSWMIDDSEIIKNDAIRFKVELGVDKPTLN